METTDEVPTSIHVMSPTKDRFDSLRRQIEAERDEDLRNTDVLDLLMDSWEGATDD